MLVNGVFIPLTAYLMQRFTTRELFLSAMLAFLAGSILSGVAPGFEVLLIGRLVQAAGAGIIMPLLMNVVLAIFPEEKRGGAMGIIGVAIRFVLFLAELLSPDGRRQCAHMLNEWQERSECFGKNSEYRWGFDHRVYKPSPILRKYYLQLPDPADE